MSLIPKSFELGGVTYNVEFSDNRPERVRNTVTGEIIYPLSKVVLYNNHVGYTSTLQYKELSFYHELIHGILTNMGKDELNDDEGFVEGFANLLHQYMKTSKYE
jgi:hypothetical protein